MTKAFFASFAFLISSLAQADYLFCEDLSDRGNTLPQIRVEPNASSLILNSDFKLHEQDEYLEGVLSSGTYPGTSTHDGNRIIVELRNWDVDYRSCNFEGAYLIFDLKADMLEINVKCDGGPAFTVVEQALSCTRY